MLAPGVFDPDKTPDGYRKLPNLDHMGLVLPLDFEHTDLCPTEVPKLFPDIKLIITNSYNHRPDGPRYRVFIPLARYPSVNAYTSLFDQVRAKLTEAGYWTPRYQGEKADGRRRSGLDTSKRHPTSLFYLPSQAATPEYSFFHFHSEGRRTLDPLEWLTNPVAIKITPDAEPSGRGDADEPRGTRGGVDQAAEEQAFEDWRNHRHDEKKRGNLQFFLLARRLSNAGRGHIEIEQILNVESQHGRHPEMRRRQIKSIMATLRKDRHSEMRQC